MTTQTETMADCPTCDTRAPRLNDAKTCGECAGRGNTGFDGVTISEADLDEAIADVVLVTGPLGTAAVIDGYEIRYHGSVYRQRNAIAAAVKLVRDEPKLTRRDGSIAS